ncbi:helix-turn-helix domain-containing protein [Streptomyces sp. NBC_01180]|uniref:helix-turn-helix domain-containing protein n=1 Tax=Streptomyces sp. NBC_01180 TaxID=2903763 RepID=UPI003864BE1E|nr:helix-turn-helix domain-containing protein [Streptomyces sp. NBC_01180]
MKKTHPSDGTFGSWLHTELQRKGYDLGLRGGGRTRFAADSGISPSTVGRLLRNEGATDTRVLAAIAETLGYPLGTVLVRAGILTEADLDAISERRDTTQPPITPEQAADELGITDPQARRVYLATVAALRDPDQGEHRAQQ